MRQPWKPIRRIDDSLQIHSRGYLPHWTLDGATYSVTTRLHDSLPRFVAERLRAEYLARVERRKSDLERPLSIVELMELELDYSHQIDDWLDRGLGSCLLRDPRVARMVLESVMKHRNIRYDIEAVCVMPNHLHLVIRPIEDWTLSRIMKSLKGFTSYEMNQILGRRGQNWQIESYDRIVRDEKDLERTVRYVLQNPMKAGLDDWTWYWPK